MEKLPEDFKAKWVAALRSGEYKQGETKMYNPATDCFCVWGVAEIAVGNDKDIIAGWAVPKSGNYQSLLPEIAGKIIDDLIDLNDGSNNLSFPEIADYIEQYL
jgi:hypothetical protein